MGAKILRSMTGLPGPLQGLVYVASGGGILTALMYAADPRSPIWKILLGVLLVVGVVLILYQLVLTLRDKSKGGKMASVLSRSGSTGGKGDPAETARRDDLRKKFEEGVETFRKAGKDLYSLPWVLLVGPSGSGKTEAIRHCGVGFPPGLQDTLQGSGGTMNMNWWFTNNSVVLDTAGRMFMQDADAGGSSEWKDFLKLLKAVRPNCPINGLLLVISSETLLKDSTEKIEKDAGAIARQLDVIQRTLDVRFPVYTVVTKCDKIIGFREFFEGLTDPNLQHQILGWSNPAPLDEAFKPEQVDAHLDQVRQRLMRRRAGLLQNPVHTTDPMARRTDQVDELFELPDNMMRIAPRLKRYLEMIFVAGEWSPKPLFLRGIYFTSSMREGQALDMALASTLGIDVESLPSSRQWEKDRSYFLRDVFLSKVFKEKGLVTSATNVSAQQRKQRVGAIFGMVAVVAVFAVLMVFGYFTFNDRIGPAARFWGGLNNGFAEGGDKEGLLVGDKEVDGKFKYEYLGHEGFLRDDAFVDRTGASLTRRADLLEQTTEQADREIKAPAVAKPLGPFLGFGDDFLGEQGDAHRAVLERTTVKPLLQAVRSKFLSEEQWGPVAVAALGEMVRLQTYSHNERPGASVDNTRRPSGPDAGLPTRPAIDIDALFRYVLDDQEYAEYREDAKKLGDAISRAYQEGFGSTGASESLGGKDAIIADSVDKVLRQIASTQGAPGSDWARLTTMGVELKKFNDAEQSLLQLEFIRDVQRAPKDPAEHERFATDYAERLKKMDDARKEIDRIAEEIGRQRLADIPKLLDEEERRVRDGALATVSRLRQQLPDPSSGMLGQLAGAAKTAAGDKAKAAPVVPTDQLDAVLGKLPEDLKKLIAQVNKAKTDVESANGPVSVAISALRTQVNEVAPLLVAFSKDAQDRRAYGLRYDVYNTGQKALSQSKTAEVPAGKVLTFSALTAAADAARDNLVRDVADRGAWQPSSDQIARLASDAIKQSVSSDRDRAIRAAQRVVELAQAMRMRKAADTYLAALEDGAGVSDLVKKLAEERVDAADDGAFKKVTLARIPMSDIKGEECKDEFHPEAAAVVLGDWASLTGLVQPKSSGGPGRSMLLDDGLRRAHADGKGKFDAYVRDYMRYWKGMGTTEAMPKAETWQDFTASIRKLNAADMLDSLKKQREIVLSAFTKIPKAFESAELLSAKKDVEDGISRVDGARTIETYDKVLDAWKEIAGQNTTPVDAANRLIDAFRNGQAGTRYFRFFNSGDAPRLDYWNELLRRGVATLKVAAASGQQLEWNNLIAQSKGVPLRFGDATEISFDQLARMRQAAQAAEQSAAPPAAEAANADSLDDEVRTILLELSGADRAQGETRDWLRKVSKVLALFTDEPKLSAEVYFETNYPAGAPGANGDARNEYNYAALVVGGNVVSRAFLISTSNPNVPDDLAGKLKAPIPATQPVEIYLWKIDPGNQPPAPNDIITLPGAYGPVGAVVRNGDISKRNDNGTWATPVVSRDGFFLWINVKTSPRPLPARSEWPAPMGGPWR